MFAVVHNALLTYLGRHNELREAKCDSFKVIFSYIPSILLRVDHVSAASVFSWHHWDTFLRQATVR